MWGSLDIAVNLFPLVVFFPSSISFLVPNTLWLLKLFVPKFFLVLSDCYHFLKLAAFFVFIF